MQPLSAGLPPLLTRFEVFQVTKSALGEQSTPPVWKELTTTYRCSRTAVRWEICPLALRRARQSSSTRAAG